jgi:hypothetical protein
LTKLAKDQSAKANALLDEVRSKLDTLAGGDPKLLFHYRRRIFIRLMHDERGTPTHRRKLKIAKLAEQNGRCAIGGCSMDGKEPELDRFEA